MTAMIARDADLREFVEQAGSQPQLALDTEFMRERTYYPELCLIQVAWPDRVVLIDPLAGLDLTPLDELLGGGPEKVLHACRQDQEVLATRLAAPLAPVFDTQLAAALCGFPPQWSYANLVAEFAGVELAKGATRTDWSRRPLSDAQLEYAADDVRFLLDAREALLQRLAELGRLGWFEQDMAALAALPWDVAPEAAWRRVKGHGQLAGPALAALQTLAAWRERKAQRSDKPRRWVAKDESLVALAQARPENAPALQALSGVEDFLKRRRAGELLEAIAGAQDAEPPVLDDRIPDKAAVKRLRAGLQRIAGELRLDASLLATRADLEALTLDGRCPRLEEGWRRDVVYQPLQSALAL